MWWGGLRMVEMMMIVDLIEAEIGILFYSKEDLGKYSTDNCGFVND